MNRLYSAILICLLIAKSIGITSQQVTISGYVADETTGEYLIGAYVFDTSNFKGCITNKYGYYSIKTEKGNNKGNQIFICWVFTKTLTSIFRSDTTINIKLKSVVTNLYGSQGLFIKKRTSGAKNRNK